MNFEQVLRNHQLINTLTRSLIKRPAFNEINVLIPDPGQPEPGFMRATSWLYCLYFEGGRISINFLRRQGEAYGLMNRETSDSHIEAVRCLRTELHHNLGFADSDQQARTSAEVWRRKACGTAFPKTEKQWLKCYTLLVGEASEFLGGIEQVVRRIEADGEKASHEINQWKHRLNRSWPAPLFDPLIEDAKFRLGRPALNTVSFRNRHVERWRKHLDLLEDEFAFEREAMLLIEKALLDDSASVLPITGREIIDELKVKPGPLVGKLLEEARRFYELEKCSKDEILKHLQKYCPSS